MKAQLVEVIEVEVGGVKRYFTASGETIGIVGGEVEPASAFSERTAARVDDLVKRAARPRDWRPPPFDPREGPRMDVGGQDERAAE